MRKTCSALVLVVIAAAPLAAEEWNKTFSLTGTPDVRVQTNDARIEVSSWDRPQIEAHVTTEGWRIADDEVRISDTQTGNRIGLEVHIPNRDRDWGFDKIKRSVHIALSVPRQANLDLRTGDGSVSLEPVEGTVHVHTGDGAVTAQGLRGEVQLATGDGRIEARGLSGSIRLSTSDGGIDVSDIEGEVELSSGDGHIEARGVQPTLKARTGDGRINVEGLFTRLELHSDDGHVTATVREGSRMSGDWSITTNDGSIALRLPQDFGAELDARTGDGRVTLDFPVKVSGSISRSRVQGTIEAGGPRLQLSTGDGSIHLQKL